MIGECAVESFKERQFQNRSNCPQLREAQGPLCLRRLEVTSDRISIERAQLAGGDRRIDHFPNEPTRELMNKGAATARSGSAERQSAICRIRECLARFNHLLFEEPIVVV